MDNLPIAFSAVTAGLLCASYFLPCITFGLACAWRARNPDNPMHTDETGMPVY